MAIGFGHFCCIVVDDEMLFCFELFLIYRFYPDIEME